VENCLYPRRKWRGANLWRFVALVPPRNILRCSFSATIYSIARTPPTMDDLLARFLNGSNFGTRRQLLRLLRLAATGASFTASAFGQGRCRDGYGTSSCPLADTTKRPTGKHHCGTYRR
jgi:hypothetical protein